MENQDEQLKDVSPDPERVEYVVTDTDNPRSVLNLIKNCPRIHEAILRLMIEEPELLSLDEGSLHKLVHPTVGMQRIRFSFWAEYENCASRGRPMKQAQIIGGILTEQNFKESFLANNKKVAYMLCPPTNYVVQVKEALQAGFETVRQIVSAKVIDEDGFLIPRAADVVLKAVALLDIRVKGSIVQRIDQRTLNMNMEAPPQIQIPESLDDLERQIAEVRKKLIATPRRQELLNNTDDAHDISNMRDLVDVKIEDTNTLTKSACRIIKNE